MRQLPSLQVVGGVVSGSSATGATRLVADAGVHTDGAVGVLLGPDWPIRAVVSPGCQPLGRPYTVTRAERSVIYEIGGMPAQERLLRVLDSLSPAERDRTRAGVLLARVADERALEPGRGEILVSRLQGFDPDNGALAVTPEIELGATVQFQLRDAVTADAELRELLLDASGQGALLFTGTERGIRLFGAPDHDAARWWPEWPARRWRGCSAPPRSGPSGAVSRSTRPPRPSPCSVPGSGPLPADDRRRDRVEIRGCQMSSQVSSQAATRGRRPGGQRRSPQGPRGSA